MANRLNGKIALVTAAGQGIGRAISEAFIAEGATVIATDVDPGKLDGLAAARRDKLDVRSTAAVDAFAEQVTRAFGSPDILVNCAGFVHHGTVLDCSEGRLGVLVRSQRHLDPSHAPRVPAGDAGKAAGLDHQHFLGRLLDPWRAQQVRLRATKAAIIGLTKAVAADFIRQGIRANAICPGTIETPSLDTRVADLSKSSHRPVDAVRQDFIDRQPMGRLGTPQEVAALAVFLASDEASYITGQTHLVDGGMAL